MPGKCFISLYHITYISVSDICEEEKWLSLFKRYIGNLKEKKMVAYTF